MSNNDYEKKMRELQLKEKLLHDKEQLLHEKEQQLRELDPSKNSNTSVQNSSSSSKHEGIITTTNSLTSPPIQTAHHTENVAPKHEHKYLNATDGTRVIHDDMYLESCAQALRDRYSRYKHKKSEIEKNEGSLIEFAQGYKKFGFNRIEGGIMFREWAPNARQMFLMGEFNGWNRQSHECQKNQYGVFELFLKDIDGRPAIRHNTKVKLSLITHNDERLERIPVWIKVVWQEKGNIHFDGVYYDPPQEHRHVWKHDKPGLITKTINELRIYEVHIGMSSPDPKISTYAEFTRDLLPYIKDLGYNTIQIMAIMEHAYYASFGYQVTNFFAISSRFGTPDELKALIDRAHELDLVVLLDLVHSHASKNVDDGLNRFDGTDHQYFHEGGKGNHPIWDSRLFNYGHWEVLRFLLSNANFFISEYHFDGYRFDGITSMIYQHHGVAHDFVGGYDEYFNGDLVDYEAVTYLTLCNDMLHQLDCHGRGKPITIAEEVSGFATLCRPIKEGGIGFDYRLAMGIPDFWISLMKGAVPDEDWNMGNIAWNLTNRRYLEPSIAYVESHDQALVGDKTMAFWLMDKEMYTNMSVLQPMNAITDRGMALHKMIRLITFGLGGEGYLTFMGNEFGHPEWIDFPREGNNDSYHYARRRFDLPKDKLLRYQQLLNFERAMHKLEAQYHWLSSPQAYVTLKHEGDKVLAFERGNLFWVFNFHPTKSFGDYAIGISHPGKYKIVLDSDTDVFGGHNRVNHGVSFFSQPEQQHGREHRLMLYLPCRCALVLALDH